MVLMCGNIPVLDLLTYEVLNKDLLPGMLLKDVSKETFKKWAQGRYSSNTNKFARDLKGLTFGQGNRQTIDRRTHSFSLSDSYWLKDAGSDLLFEQVSPYYADFWKGSGGYRGGAIPTLYADGFLSKYWEDRYWLYKESTNLEVECSRLCRGLDIPVAFIRPRGKGILVKNFTSPTVMFEPAEASGGIDPDEFVDDDVISLFGSPGFDMILIDAIIGNGDRHARNFGFLRSTSTGQYLGMAPLFDFDHALDTKESVTDILISSVVSLTDKYRKKSRVLAVTESVQDMDTNPMFKLRAKTIHELVEASNDGKLDLF